MFRFIQGTAAAMMVPQIVSIIGVKFSGSLRVRALSANAGVVAGGFLAGQILGGVLVTANLLGAGWRSIFIVNVPIGIVLAILVLLRVPADVASDPQKLDIGGVVLACASVGSVIVPLVLGREFGWPVWSWVSIAAGVLVGGVFVAVERRIAETSRQPLLNFGVVGVPGFALGLLMLVAVMMALGGFGFSLTLQLQNIWGFSPLETGLVFVASGVCSAAASLYWRHLPSRWYRYLPAVGVVMLAISYVGVSVIFIGPPGGYIVLQCVLAFGGAGLGAVFGAGTTHALTNVPPTLASDASGLLSTVMQLGQAVGVAAIGGVFFTLRSQSDPGIAHAAGAVSVGLSAAVAALGAIAAVVRLTSAHEHR